MKVYDLDGYESKWNMGGKEVHADTRPRSSLHKAAREVLRSRFPTLQMLEEVRVKVRKGKTLYIDFYFPLRKLAVEVHGQQHYSFNSMFHNTTQDFMRQCKNDRDKAEWCEINGIELIVFKYDEEEDWTDQI